MAPDEARPVTSSRASAPVFILGGHRSGTSAVTGLLSVAGGLELGEVLPPTKANAKGYFESVSLVRAHNQMLAALDRDWTCPPADFEPTEAGLDALRAEAAILDGSGRTWGLKDPRLLYMLPAWVQVLPEVRFVAVVRDHEESVRSLVARDGLDPGVADTITRAYARRLRGLVERFDLPVIDFSAGTDEVLGATEKVAGGLGLRWDPEAAAAFYEPSLAVSRARGAAHNPDVDHLRALAGASSDAPAVSADALRRALDQFALVDDEFDRYSGPRAASRRAQVWRALPRDLSPAIEFARTTKLAASFDPVRAGGEAVACPSLMDLYSGLRNVHVRPEGVLLPDITSWVSSEQLEPALRMVHDAMAPDGMVVICRSRADVETRVAMGWAPIEDGDLEATARAAGFLVLSRRADPMTTVLRLTALATPVSVLRSLQEEGFDVGGVRAPRRRKGPDERAEEPTRRGQTDDAVVWKRKYERLRGRRSVRLVLGLARYARPLFRLVRRIRRADARG